MAIPASKTDYLTINNGDLTIKHTGIGIYWDILGCFMDSYAVYVVDTNMGANHYFFPPFSRVFQCSVSS
jgi:hypothetical protein